MKILMIGGTGTISYDATKFFLAKGHQVYLLNRGNRNDLKNDNLHYIIGNANDVENLTASLEDYDFDVIIDFIIFNVSQMKMRLPILAKKCKQFVFISSATAYQLVEGLITEDTPIGNNKWKYSREKGECEKYLENNIKQYNCSFTIVRPYITYDDRRIPFPVITKSSYYSLLDRIQKKKPVILCGDGNTKLTLTHTKDFAVALEGLLLNPKAINEAFHITGDCVTTWNEILSIVEENLGIKAEPVYIPVDFLSDKFASEREELLYDKSCDHVYSNEKICNAVPAFRTTYTVKEGISLTVKNLMSHSTLQSIDHPWNYTEDCIIEQYEKTQGKVVHKATLWAKFVYWVYQKTDLKVLQRAMNKFWKIRGKR